MWFSRASASLILAVIRMYRVFFRPLQICPGLKANEIQIPYDKHHKGTKTHRILSNMK